MCRHVAALVRGSHHRVQGVSRSSSTARVWHYCLQTICGRHQNSWKPRARHLMGMAAGPLILMSAMRRRSLQCKELAM